MTNHKAHFSRSLQAAPGRLHFAAHSHHLWPDVTFDAQAACWEDAARLADRKWERVFGEVMPQTQQAIARVLGLSSPDTIAFAPNTHELLCRLLSCLPVDRAPRILCSDSEFYSFTRQVARLEEEGLADVTRVPVEPFTDFASRFAAAAEKGTYDLIFVSQVFFNSGFAIAALEDLVRSLPDDETFIVVDGYHGFLARPTDLGPVEGRIFYLSGGYKYAMAGEGVCFLHAPDGYGPRPRNTGWYAAFGALEQMAGEGVAYAADGRRFLGATFDPVGIYRLRAVLSLLDDLGLGAGEIHAHALALQCRFIEGLERLSPAVLPLGSLLLDPRDVSCGQFLTFDLAAEQAAALQARLMAAEVITDHRGSRLRFGFGIYQDETDVAQLLDRIAAL
ncbi:aminotransferase class V-fold PLP-dependent enzyme [Pelagibius litoralis]|uniref:Aminotransferase class V-fold PLP-dependent enzyme n=1 Tax=Pelagibius litoralis TaxID=374515 RepID=A0A967EUT7_9PROT|nr:aminotransferase class V-fold PLP-dependent enzyme [Pelagibius litoralis]NIA67517.1 aminotransferase class V-fold PLP-dependent enzyme [Pelagibius litoralis]